MYKHILLTGGTGLVGARLTKALLDKGYEVSHLSRNPGNNPKVKTYLWNVAKGEIDEACITGVDTIVHLAGAGVVDKRWSDERKKEIIDSRTKSIGLIYRLLRKKNHIVKTVISASATGYYGDRGAELLTEDSQKGKDFLAEVCVKWEAAADEGKDLGFRVVKFRTGIVLDKDGSALPQLANPVKWGVGSPLGSGGQWTPWIHWRDVVKMYVYGIEHVALSGVYNMTGPNPVTNKQLTKAVAQQLHKPFWAPNVPVFVLKLIMGEMRLAVLESTRTSSKKIEDTGFKFDYPELSGALKEIYG
ncbi:TIGR01777 family oxidoreductase [Mucilaginibacter sp. L196]|uniref:TIGR01777 family oxidoreductase n=1 Tax=Mucilaginibacter sp. L196 TaxID=1641870 RepID=UPI00131AF0F5|nr:TIGR01777 family oxidoreductase [Mucilaginibacter sp. L196]